MTMWTHASDAALMDVVDGTAGDRVLSHVRDCPRCGTRVEEARGALAWAEAAVVPDPIPSYWDVLRRHVARGIAEAPAAPSRRPLWAAAAVVSAAVLVALLSAVPGPAPRSAEKVAGPALPAWSALPPADEDPGLPLLEQAAPAVAAFTAVECGDVAECLAVLTDEESAELADALRDQLGSGRTL
jgi:hypothetical protein